MKSADRVLCRVFVKKIKYTRIFLANFPNNDDKQIEQIINKIGFIIINGYFKKSINAPHIKNLPTLNVFGK